MSFLLKDTIHQVLVDSIYNEFLSRKSNYYYYIGKVLDWGDSNNPDTPEDTGDYEYQTRNKIISVKRINISDVSYVVPRIDWTTDTVYDQYDPDYSPDFPAASGAEKIKDATFYVLTSNYGVYKCIFNNDGAQSTIEPTGSDVTPVTYGDGYIWKYLYTIPLSSRNRFLTDDYMPVQKAINNVFYSNGEISSIVIDGSGSGYFNNSEVTLSVTGTFLGLSGNSIANLTPVLSDTGQFIDVLIDAPGANYKNASITITDNLGAGYSYYNSIANVSIYDVGAGYTAAARNNTTISISTSGPAQPTANAVAEAVYSGTNNGLIGVNLTNPGAGYTTAARNNTTIDISTTGAVQPTANATANLYFNSTAILTPVLLNGSIEKVLIEDPGSKYSANNRTTIATIGDGTGAVLQPVINSAGELADVIIHARGEGYTYLDIEIVGDGTGANAYATLSSGDLNTIQSVIELSAIDGSIQAFKIDNNGDGYSEANVAVYGDGDGFVGEVVVTDNTISKITVTNPGYGYTFANVIITGDGANATASAIISPPGGHGKNVIKELFADTIMFYSTINNEKNQNINVSNDYRQFGIIKDIKKFNSDLAFTSPLGSSCYLITMDTVSGLSSDDVLTLTDDNDQVRSFEIVEVVSDTNQLLITNINNYDLAADDVLTNTLLASFTVASIDELPTINKFSGDLLYIDNRTTVSYSDQQLVTLRTIIQL